MHQKCCSQSLLDHHHPIDLLCVMANSYMNAIVFGFFLTIWVNAPWNLENSGFWRKSQSNTASCCKNYLWIAEWVITQWRGSPWWCIRTLASRYFFFRWDLHTSDQVYWKTLPSFGISYCLQLWSHTRTMLWNFVSMWWTSKEIGSTWCNCSTSERTRPQRRPDPQLWGPDMGLHSPLPGHVCMRSEPYTFYIFLVEGW